MKRRRSPGGRSSKEELEGQESMQEELCDLVKHALVPVKQVLEDYGRRSWRTMAA